MLLYKINLMKILNVLIIFQNINSQIYVLAPPSVVQKVKELENGSKL